MYIIDRRNSREHSYPVYGRRFRTYKWVRPIFTGLLFAFLFLLLGVILMAADLILVHRVTSMASSWDVLNNLDLGSYDTMDLADPEQTVLSLGSVAVMIPALWLAAIIVRDRPFSSYSSARGGWSGRVFMRTLPIGILCVSIPIIVWELFHEHHLNDFQMRFTLVSFLVVTIIGPLQCIAEEYAFRGLLMQTLGSWVRVPAIAVVLQAALFALAHPYNRIGQLGIFVSGMAFGLSAWIGRGIEVSSVYHICNNMTIFYMQGMNLSNISGESDMNSFIFETIMAVVYVVVIFIISRKTDLFNKVKRDDAAAWNEKYGARQARKEGKTNEEAEIITAPNLPDGVNEDNYRGRHYKQ